MQRRLLEGNFQQSMDLWRRSADCSGSCGGWTGFKARSTGQPSLSPHPPPRALGRSVCRGVRGQLRQPRLEFLTRFRPPSRLGAVRRRPGDFAGGHSWPGAFRASALAGHKGSASCDLFRYPAQSTAYCRRGNPNPRLIRPNCAASERYSATSRGCARYGRPPGLAGRRHTTGNQQAPAIAVAAGQAHRMRQRG